jgi:hypothetical protein
LNFDGTSDCIQRAVEHSQYVITGFITVQF